MLIADVGYGQSYQQLVKDGATWSQVRWYWGIPHEVTPECDWMKYYRLNGDTIISGKEYLKLYGINHANSWDYEYINIDHFELDSAEYIAAVREDSAHKVFIIDADESTEFVLYDFALNEGDTFCFDYIGFECYPVTYIDSVLIDGEYRKTINFIDFSNYMVWIEGIGNSIGWFELQLLGSWSWDLLCYSFEEDTIHFSSNCSCNPEYLTIGNNPQLSPIKIFPIPASDIIHFAGNSEIKEIDFSDFSGRLYSKIVYSRWVDVSAFAAGFYTVAIRMENGEKYFTTVIIQ